MDSYVTGTVIRRLREDKRMTQEQLAEKIHVSSKTVSKWETGKGLPDISLLESLAEALGISMIELFSGDTIQNKNRSANMAKTVFYVCPVCGNVICSSGETVVSCCGIALPPLEPDEPDEEHAIKTEIVEDEYYVLIDHTMTKDHSIKFLAAVSGHSIQLVKLYPEGNAEARFKIDRVQYLYAYCNRHGLFRVKVR
jgi:DNA-binding XRE family transcriptional regulator/desulfoferrodoxin (superoxide reductase-like protein)